MEGRLWQRVKLMTWQLGWILPQDECGYCSSWKWAERWLWGRERVSRSQSQIRHFPWGQDMSGPYQPISPHRWDNLVYIVMKPVSAMWTTLPCSHEETSTLKSCIPNRHRQVKKSYAMQQGYLEESKLLSKDIITITWGLLPRVNFWNLDVPCRARTFLNGLVTIRKNYCWGFMKSSGST